MHHSSDKLSRTMRPELRRHPLRHIIHHPRPLAQKRLVIGVGPDPDIHTIETDVLGGKKLANVVVAKEDAYIWEANCSVDCCHDISVAALPVGLISSGTNGN